MINAATATVEARACALNNRADIHGDHGDLAAALADRTAVLTRRETSYDPHILCSRHVRVLWQTGEQDAALSDSGPILATDDIVLEQKIGRSSTAARHTSEP